MDDVDGETVDGDVVKVCDVTEEHSSRVKLLGVHLYTTQSHSQQSDSCKHLSYFGLITVTQCWQLYRKQLSDHCNSYKTHNIINAALDVKVRKIQRAKEAKIAIF